MNVNYWIGVIGKKSTMEQFQSAQEFHFCLPSLAEIGDRLVAYVTASASKKNQGLYGIFEIAAFNKGRDCDCKGYGSFTGVRPSKFVHLKEIHLNSITTALKELKKDPVLSRSVMVRRNAQGTYFQINKKEYDHFEKFCKRRQ